MIEDLKETSPDVILFLGDLVMKGPQPKECVDLLRNLQPAKIVRGNYDNLFTRFPKPGWQAQTEKQAMVARAFAYDAGRLSLADQEWLGNLPERESIDLNGHRFDLFHASPNSLSDIIWPWATNEELQALCLSAETKGVFFGHVHHGFVRHAEGRLFVNSGSIGMPFDGDNRSSYAVIDLVNGNLSAQLRRVSYDIEQAITVAKDCQMPDVNLFEHALRTATYPYV